MKRTFFKTLCAAAMSFVLVNAGILTVPAADSVMGECSAQVDSTDVTFTKKYHNDMESAVISGYSPEGLLLWSYSTGSYQQAQLSRIDELGMRDGVYYLVEDGTILALDTADGSVLWKNSEFGGSTDDADFDENGTLYVCGYLGPDLFVVDSEGNTVKKVSCFDSSYGWPCEIHYLGEFLAITFELTPSGSRETLYVNVKDDSYFAGEDAPAGYCVPRAAVPEDAVSSVTASSYLKEPQYGLEHKPSYVLDKTLENAWVENAPGQGEGESLTLQLNDTYLVSGFRINAGYQKNSDIYEKNSRPAVLWVTFSDGTGVKASLLDYNGRQKVVFPSAVETSSLTFTIRSVYPGVKYTDTVISEISLF